MKRNGMKGEEKERWRDCKESKARRNRTHDKRIINKKE